MAVARAGTTFDGTFMHVARGLVEYFSLTQTGGDVAGFYCSLLADPSAVNGIKETRINVSGVTDGNRVNFREGSRRLLVDVGLDRAAVGRRFSPVVPVQWRLLNGEPISNGIA